MTKHQRPAKHTGRGQRHPLLFQQRFSEQIFWPSTVTLAVSIALLLWKPPIVQALLPIVYAGLAIASIVLVVAYAFRLRAFAQCRNDGLLIQLPFFRVILPYETLKMVRPTALGRLFPPDQERWTSRSYLERLAARTVLVVELEQYPKPLFWLRLWMHKYMICPDRVGFVLAVRDWMAFRGELDEYRTRSFRPQPST